MNISFIMGNHRWRKMKSGLVTVLCSLSAVLVAAPLALVFYHLVRNGAAAVSWSFFTELPKPVGVTGGGMANAIVGSLQLLGLAAIIGIPPGVLGGVYLAEGDPAPDRDSLRTAGGKVAIVLCKAAIE